MDQARHDAEVEAYNRDRNEALLTLNKDKIVAHFKRYNPAFEMPSEEVFWTAIHKARTAIPALPPFARSISKQWLESRGLKAWDDGDVKGLF